VSSLSAQPFCAASLSWIETRTAVVIGKTTVEYAADTDRGTTDWEIWISFPVVAPEAAVYEAMVFRRFGDFYWEGIVGTAGQVAELRVNVVREAGLEQKRLVRVGRICGIMGVDAFRPRGRAASCDQLGRWRRE
jgi:hypothetical protein